MKSAGSRFLWVAAVVVLVGVFAGGAAIAEVPLRTTCNFLDASGKSSGYSFVVSPEGGEWPIWNSTFSKWEWRYSLETSTGKYNYARVTYTWPACGTPIKFWTVDSTGTVLNEVFPNDPGVGDDSYQFGWWDGTKYTAGITPNSNSSPRLYSLFTDSVLPAANTYVGMKIGNGTYSCQSIAGPACPDCPGLPFQPATITQCMEIEGNNIMLVRNTNRCITEVWKCTTAGCSGYPTGCTKLNPNVTVNVVARLPDAQNQEGITVGDILGNQICPEGILFSASSPGCSNVRTLSGWVQVCK